MTMTSVRVEDGRPPVPVPFVTARRFWTLVYILTGGVLTAMGIARLVGRPMMRQILLARQSFVEDARQGLVALITSLTTSLTTLPGRKIVVDTKRHRLYIDTQTQTSGDDLNPIEEEMDEAEASVHKTCERLRGIAGRLSDLSGPEENRAYTRSFEATTSLKDVLQDLETSGYRRYDAGAGSFGNVKAGSDNVVQRIKAEVRSVKGSCLSLRAP